MNQLSSSMTTAPPSKRERLERRALEELGPVAGKALIAMYPDDRALECELEDAISSKVVREYYESFGYRVDLQTDDGDVLLVTHVETGIELTELCMATKKSNFDLLNEAETELGKMFKRYSKLCEELRRAGFVYVRDLAVCRNYVLFGIYQENAIDDEDDVCPEAVRGAEARRRVVLWLMHEGGRALPPRPPPGARHGGRQNRGRIYLSTI